MLHFHEGAVTAPCSQWSYRNCHLKFDKHINVLYRGNIGIRAGRRGVQFLLISEKNLFLGLIFREVRAILSINNGFSRAKRLSPQTNVLHAYWGTTPSIKRQFYVAKDITNGNISLLFYAFYRRITNSEEVFSCWLCPRSHTFPIMFVDAVRRTEPFKNQ